MLLFAWTGVDTGWDCSGGGVAFILGEMGAEKSGTLKILSIWVAPNSVIGVVSVFAPAASIDLGAIGKSSSRSPLLGS